MTTLNTLTTLANALGELALETTDKGIAIGLQQARCIVLGEAAQESNDPIAQGKLIHTMTTSAISAIEAQLAYMAEQKQPVETPEEEASDSTSTDHELDMHLDELMREFKDWDTETKPLFLDANEDKFTKELDAFIEQLDKDMQVTKDDELVGLPEVKHVSTGDLDFEAELRKFFEGF